MDTSHSSVERYGALSGTEPRSGRRPLLRRVGQLARSRSASSDEHILLAVVDNWLAGEPAIQGLELEPGDVE